MEKSKKKSKKDQEEIRAIDVLSRENIFEVLPTDVLGIILKDFGIKALGYALRTSKWFNTKSSGIIAAIFNGRHAPESWALYIKNRPDDLFRKNPLKALQAYEMTMFFVTPDYLGAHMTLFKRKDNQKAIKLYDVSKKWSDDDERIIEITATRNVKEVDQWIEKSYAVYSLYNEKYIIERRETFVKDQIITKIVADPRSVQNLILFALHDGYKLDTRIQGYEYTGEINPFGKDGPIKIRRPIQKEKYAHLFSCVGCGIDFVYGKCEECAQSYCSDACHRNNHKNGCKTKIK
jgi:hypothetical protein